MTTCVPIKELKNISAFSALVEASTEPVIITRNGTEAFAAISMGQLEAFELQSSRNELYRLIAEAEEDFAEGRFVDARESQAKARERYGL